MSNGTKTFEFKPALLKSKQSYFVTENHIEHANKDGSDTTVLFKDITSMRYVATHAREYTFRRLDILYGDNKKCSINLSLPFASDVHSDKNLFAFLGLMHDIARRLEHARPDLTIAIGETSRINWIYFVIGAISIFSAGGILLVAYISGVSDQKLMKGLLPTIIMVGFGAYICVMAKPWVKRPDITMYKFKLLIATFQQG